MVIENSTQTMWLRRLIEINGINDVLRPDVPLVVSVGCGIDPQTEVQLAISNPDMDIIGVEIDPSIATHLTMMPEFSDVVLPPDNLHFINAPVENIPLIEHPNISFLYLFPNTWETRTPIQKLAPPRLADGRSIIQLSTSNKRSRTEYISMLLSRYPFAHHIIATELVYDELEMSIPEKERLGFSPLMRELNMLIQEFIFKQKSLGHDPYIGGDLYDLGHYSFLFPVTPTLQHLVDGTSEIPGVSIDRLRILTYEINPNKRPTWRV